MTTTSVRTVLLPDTPSPGGSRPAPDSTKTVPRRDSAQVRVSLPTTRPKGTTLWTGTSAPPELTQGSRGSDRHDPQRQGTSELLESPATAVPRPPDQRHLSTVPRGDSHLRVSLSGQSFRGFRQKSRPKGPEVGTQGTTETGRDDGGREPEKMKFSQRQKIKKSTGDSPLY